MKQSKHEENVENQNKVSAYFYVAGGKKWLQMNGGKCEKYGEKMLVFLRLSFFFLFSAASECDIRKKSRKLAEKLFSFKAKREGDDKMICQQRQHCARQRSHDKWRIFLIFIFFCIAEQADSRFNGSLHRLMTLSRSSFLSMFRSPIAFQSITSLKHIRVCAGNLSLLKVSRFFCVHKVFPLFFFSYFGICLLTIIIAPTISIHLLGWLAAAGILICSLCFISTRQ